MTEILQSSLELGEAADRGRESKNEYSKEQLESAALKLRKKIDKLLQRADLDNQPISSGEWTQLYAILPQDLLKALKLNDAQMLSEWVQYGHDLPPDLKKVVHFEFPSPLQPEHLSQVYNDLKALNLHFFELGVRNEKYDHALAQRQAKNFSKKMERLKNELEKLRLQSSLLFLDPVFQSLSVLILNFQKDSKHFSEDFFFSKLRPNADSTEGMDTHDVLTQYRRYGLSQDQAFSLISKRVPSLTVAGYFITGLLSPYTFPFLEANIPDYIVLRFFQQFSPEDLYRFRKDLESPFVAELVLASLQSPDTSPSFDFIPKLISAGFTELSFEANPVLEIYKKLPGANHAEKQKILLSYMKAGFSRDMVLEALQDPSITLEAFENISAQHPSIDRTLLLKAMHSNISLDLLDLALRYLPSSDFNHGELNQLVDWPIGPSEFEAYLQTVKGVSIFSLSTIRQLIHLGVSTQTIREYQQHGILRLDNIFLLARQSVSPDDVSKILHLIPTLSAAEISELYETGVTLSQVSEFSALLQGELKPLFLDAKSLLQILELTKLPQYREKFLEYYRSNINFIHLPEALKMNLTPQELQWIRNEEFSFSDIKLIRDFSLHSLIPHLKNSAHSTFNSSAISELSTMLKAGASHQNLQDMLKAGFPIFFMKSIVQYQESWQRFEPYKNSFRNLPDLDLAEFLGISPERLKTYPSDMPMDDLVRLELKAGFLSSENADFLNRYHLSFPGRYPLTVLRAMKQRDQSPEQSKKLSALVVMTRNDWNGAFYQVNSNLKSLLKAYDVTVMEVASDTEFLEAVEQFGSMDLLIIGGHGNPTGINFSSENTENSNLDISDTSKLNSISSAIKPNGTVALLSCSTGAGGAGAENIASTLSRALGGVPVIAPTIPTNVDHFRLDKDGRLVGVEYSDKGAEQRILLRQDPEGRYPAASS